MLYYILSVNRVLLVCILMGVSVAIAQDAAPPLPNTPTGWGDLFVKSSPFLIGALNIYLPDVLKMYMPKLFAKVPMVGMKVVGAVLTILTSGLNAYVTQEALGGVGGVQPDVAMASTATTNLIVAGAKPKTEEDK